MPETTHHTRIQWLPPEMGGRIQPPTGPRYTATARFAEDPLDKQFSVVFRLSPVQEANGPAIQEAELGLLFPDRMTEVGPGLQPERLLLVHEGRRVVGLCTIVKARDVEPSSATAGTR